MQLQSIKMIACSMWALAILATAVALGASGAGIAAAAVFGLLPPLAILLLWNEPAQTMSEIINKARR